MTVLSRRDGVIVAWQFTAWNRLETAFRPVRVRCDPVQGSVLACRTPNVMGPRSYRLYETGFFSVSSQAVNCQVAFADYGAPEAFDFARPTCAIAT
jgi:hypothetical protein